jgi:hypothetical protein
MMDRIIQWLTTARVLWFALVIAAGSVGTGVGFLLGEGSARALFAAQYADHERRLSVVEMQAREAVTTSSRILEGLAELKGEVRALRKEVRP